MRSHWIVTAYAASGFVIGFVFLPLIPLVRAVGWPRDTSVGIALYGLMPALIVVAGVVHPRLVVNLLGVLAAIGTWSAGYAVACTMMEFDGGSIGYNLVIMAPFTVPVYFLLTFLAFALGRLRRGKRVTA
jgi:hypothetical protein